MSSATLSKWDVRFLGLAQHIAGWSKDDSTKVGAVIVTPQQRIVSTGFNGPPRGVQDDPAIDRETKLRRTIHAEKNAVLFAQRDLAGCSIYVTHHPCGPCAAFIAQAGIARVVVQPTAGGFDARWAADILEARRTFEQAEIQLLIPEL